MDAESPFPDIRRSHSGHPATGEIAHPLGREATTDGHKGPDWLIEECFRQLFDSGRLIDGRAGGLLLGRSHEEGNVYMISGPTPDKTYVFCGNAEGGEYFVNHDATFHEQARLHEINSFKGDHPPLSAMDLSPASRLINTHASPTDKLLWIGNPPMFIVNKNATSKFFRELEAINQSRNHFRLLGFDIQKAKEQQP